METKTMEILMETRCHSETKGCHWQKLYLRYNLAHFNVSSFLDCYALHLKDYAHKSGKFY